MTPVEQAQSLYAGGQYSQAQALAEHQIGPLLNLAGAAAYAMGMRQEAEQYWCCALELFPGSCDAYNNIGMLLAESGRLDEAEAAYRRALALHPGHVEAHNNLGVLLAKLRRPDEAEAVYRAALALRPDYTEARNNLGILLATTERPGEAEDCFRRTLALRPGDADVHYHLALLLLSLGRFGEAWPHYEARYHPEKTRRLVVLPALPFPPWRGEALAGKSLLVWHEQGYGDEIQFCRLLPLLKARGAAHVGLLCKPALAALFHTLAGVDAVYPAVDGQSFPCHDYWVLPMSLPLHLGLGLESIPANLPYLHAEPGRVAQWQARLPTARPRVGLVWKGGEAHGNDACRSLPSLALLAPLWSVSGVAFVSLQKGAGEDEGREPPSGQPLTHLGSDLEDFADTAAIVAQLDLIICVDTAVAHLAGALGKPCWVLLPAVRSDWRWLRGREDSPWYPKVMRLFRQGRSDAWEEVIGRVAEALRQWRAGRP